MIRINLLPTKRKVSKKMGELQQQMVLGGLILVLAGMVAGFWWVNLNRTITILKQAKAQADVRIREQDNLLKEVQGIEAERKLVQDKIAIIEQLKKNQSGPVRLLDELSRLLPEGVNFTSLIERAGQVDLEGEAFSNNDIVRFIDNLKESAMFSDIFLSESRQKTTEGVELYQYKLQFRFAGA